MEKENVEQLEAPALRVLIHTLYEELRRAELAVISTVNRNASARDSIVRMRARIKRTTEALDNQTLELLRVKQEYDAYVNYHEAYRVGVLDVCTAVLCGRKDYVPLTPEQLEDLNGRLVIVPASFTVPEYAVPEEGNEA